MSSAEQVRALCERHNVDDMLLVVLVPQPVDGKLSGDAAVFSPHGRVSPAIAADLLHTIAWGLEGSPV